LGWEVEELGEEAGNYALATLRGRQVAGLGPQQNPGPPFWTVYVIVDDAAATAELVAANGGQVIVPAMEVMDSGTMAVFQDPVGAFISAWQPDQHQGCGLVNEPGTFSWCELTTDGLDDAKTFYRAVFGWESDTHGEGPGAYTEFALDGRSIAGMMAKPPGMPPEAPSFWAVYFAVDDCDAAVAKITESGGSLMMGPMDIEPGRFAVVTDPAGAMFYVMKLNEPPASAES
jgi:predicted enzyme related to lactoylglutathione lyase